MPVIHMNGKIKKSGREFSGKNETYFKIKTNPINCGEETQPFHNNIG